MPDLPMTPVETKRPRRHRSRHLSSGARYAIYIALAILATAFVGYANYLRVKQLENKMMKRALIETMFAQDDRFRQLRIKINQGAGFTTVSGVVANPADMNALRAFLMKTAPPPQTAWKLSVEVFGAKKAQPQASGTNTVTSRPFSSRPFSLRPFTAPKWPGKKADGE